MLRIIALLTLALLSACASSPTKTSRGSDESKLVQVTGTGSTFDEAKMNGFKRAIEYVVGSVILTEKESKNDRLARDDIINHSSGYVDNFTILNEARVSGKYQVTMDVFVKHSAIANRILNRDKETTVVDGDKLSWQYKSYLDSHKTSMEMFRTVLNDYPTKSFSVKKTSSNFMLDRRNNARLVIEYKLDWNYSYLAALNETLGIRADERNSSIAQNKVIVISKNPKDFIPGRRDSFYFNNDEIYNLVTERLRQDVVVYAKIIDINDKVLRCGAVYHSIVDGGYSDVPLYVPGGKNLQGDLDISIDPELAVKMRNAQRIELGVTVDMDYCRKFN